MNSIPKAAAAAAAALAVLASPSTSQNFNVDVGLGNGAPDSTYGAASGQTGHWNEWDVETTMSLLALNGSATGVQISKVGGSTNYYYDAIPTTGNDALLLDSMQDLGNLPSNKTTYTLTGLSNGSYTAYIYAWTPYDPSSNFTSVRLIGGNAGPQVVGGSWVGGHANLVTYAIDTITVTAGTLEVRGVPDTGWGTINGLQLIQNSACGSAPVNYCTPGVSASGCQATLSAAGTSSATAASGFVLSAANVEGDKDGLFFQGSNGRQNNSWGNGTSFQCVIPPVKRLGLLGKTGTSGLCDGAFSQDLNAYWSAFPNKNPGAGALVQGQLWYRDPLNTSNQTTSLSEAIEWSVCP